MCRICPARTRSTPTPSPSTKAASPPPRRKRERIPRSIISNSTIPGAPKIRTSGQEIARALRGRAANPRWLQGQMRHGHRGAAEIAQSLDNLYCFAALTDAVASAQFDLMFDARSATIPCARSWSTPIVRPRAHMAGVFEEAARRGFWLSRRNSARAFWLRCCRRRHERGRVAARARARPPLSERLVSGRAAADGDRRRAARARARAERRCRSIRPRRSRMPRFACGNGAIGLSARANLQLRGVERAHAARPACAP